MFKQCFYTPTNVPTHKRLQHIQFPEAGKPECKHKRRGVIQPLCASVSAVNYGYLDTTTNRSGPWQRAYENQQHSHSHHLIPINCPFLHPNIVKWIKDQRNNENKLSHFKTLTSHLRFISLTCYIHLSGPQFEFKKHNSYCTQVYYY